MSRRTRFLSAAAMLTLAIFPGTALAQSAIAGVVRDATGAVLPGVTVDASSAALIERVKSSTSNEAGQYRIVDLRPGTYTVTFTLTGFTTVVRQGILLEANFTAPINVEMKVGAVAETITVTGETPVVDVQTSARREVVSQQLLEALPNGRTFVLMANLVPAVTTGQFDVGGSTQMWYGGSLNTHGSLSGDSRTMIDGMITDAFFGAGQCSCLYDNENQTQEIAVGVSGGAAESQTSGVIINRIPKTGGNMFSGDTLFQFSNERLQGQNVNDDLRARGLITPSKLHDSHDWNYSLGGPILKDKLWFFVSGRNWAFNNYIANTFNPDGTQAVDDNDLKGFPARLTSQISSKNRVTAMFDWANKIRGHRGIGVGVSPEAAFVQEMPAEHIMQAKWTSTLSNKVLFEAGYSNTYHVTYFRYEPEVAVGTCHSAFASCPPGTSYGDIPHVDTLLSTQTVAAGPGALAGPLFQPANSHVTTASLAYVTGAHSLKAGIQQRWGWLKDIRDNLNGDITQQYRNGAPFAVVTFNTPYTNEIVMKADLGIFIQDTWTTKRLTLSPGLRYDWFNTEIPEQNAPAGRWVAARHFDAIPDVPNWKNISPRIGGAYDLFGNGRTAIKGNVGKYVQGHGPGFAQTYNPLVFSSDTRTWTDNNGDDIAQENELGATSNLNFGVRRNQNPDPNIQRQYQWLWDIGVQREVKPGFGVSVSYNQRNFYNTFWTDNLAIDPGDYTLLMVPDPRGNGDLLPVYNVSRTKFGQVNELDTNSSENTRVYKGVDVTFNLRLPRGATVFGGTSTGRVLTKTCQVEDPNGLRFCDLDPYDVPFLTQFKLAGTYPLPYSVRLSANFQSSPGGERAITYQVTRTILPALVPASVNVRLNEPGSLYLDRVNQLDVNITKSFRWNRIELRPELGLFNILNASAVLGQTNTFGPSLDRLNLILDPRLVRLGLAVKF